MTAASGDGPWIISRVAATVSAEPVGWSASVAPRPGDRSRAVMIRRCASPEGAGRAVSSLRLSDPARHAED